MNKTGELLRMSQQWMAALAMPWVRRWEKRPLRQRKMHILVGFVGLLGILVVRVSDQLSRAPIPLRTVRFAATKPLTHGLSTTVMTATNQGDYLIEKQRRDKACRRVSSTSLQLIKGEKASSSPVPPVPSH